MTDIERVIEDWETILSGDPLDAPWDLIDETIELLKEQQAVIEQLRNDANVRRCKDCRYRGKIDGYCYKRNNRMRASFVEDDWFCADFDPSDEAVLEAFAEDG